MLVMRRAGQEDCRDIWEWRNDPLAVELSVSRDVVPWETHRTWYSQAIAAADRVLMIGELVGSGAPEKVGMCRFDLQDGDAYVSLNLAPAMRGKGLSAAMLGKGIAAFAESSSLRSLLATINRKNVPSIRCFERCGFVRCGEDGKFLFYRLTVPAPA